jgi:hypothetical protein
MTTTLEYTTINLTIPKQLRNKKTIEHNPLCSGRSARYAIEKDEENTTGMERKMRSKRAREKVISDRCARSRRFIEPAVQTPEKAGILNLVSATNGSKAICLYFYLDEEERKRKHPDGIFCENCKQFASDYFISSYKS